MTRFIPIPPILFACVFALSFIGCINDNAPNNPLAPKPTVGTLALSGDQATLPETVADAVERTVPGSVIVEWEIEQQGGLSIYVVQVDDQGLLSKLEIDSQGTVLSVTDASASAEAESTEDDTVEAGTAEDGDAEATEDETTEDGDAENGDAEDGDAEDDAEDSDVEEDDAEDGDTEDDAEDDADDSDKDEEIALADLPQIVTEAIAQALPSGILVKAKAETEDGILVYEVEIDVDGQSFEAAVDAEGNILEIEEED